MKTLLVLSIALALGSSLSSCGTPKADGSSTFGNGKLDLKIDSAQVAKLGSTAIKIGELSGYVNPTQAAAIRSVGKLVLKQDGSADDVAHTASVLVIEKAVEKGKITRAEADELYKLGTVPVTTTPPSDTPVSPPATSTSPPDSPGLQSAAE